MKPTRDFKPFSEYRHKDYVTLRSMKEAYGYDPVLYTVVEEKDVTPLVWACVVVVCFVSAAVTVFLWVI